MKAPDKIYIPLYSDHSPNGVHLGDDWMYEPHKEYNNVEYIRKDVLIEWAKEKYNEYKQMDEDFQGNVFIGNRYTFAEVIAKIESL